MTTTAAGLLIPKHTPGIEAFAPVLKTEEPVTLVRPCDVTTMPWEGDVIFNAKGEAIGVIQKAHMRSEMEIHDDTEFGARNRTFDRMLPGPTMLSLEVLVTDLGPVKTMFTKALVDTRRYGG